MLQDIELEDDRCIFHPSHAIKLHCIDLDEDGCLFTTHQCTLNTLFLTYLSIRSSALSYAFLPSHAIRFRCIDLDEDGCIRPAEMRHFYEEQLHRMECMAQEPVLFEDIVCQMTDMIKPEVRG